MTGLQLKNSILQLAIQGKLVPQDPNDEPASVLLEKIRKEKVQMVKDGKLKKKDLETTPITDDEKPFEIPESWEWVRLGAYCERVTDFVASGSFASLRENVPVLKEVGYAIMVKTADFSNNFTTNLTYTTEAGYNFLSNSNLFGGELIITNIGATLGKVSIVPYLNTKMTLAPNSVMIRLFFDELRDYLRIFLSSPIGFQEMKDISSGTAMKKFNKTDLKTILFPVPPLSEQQRIVAKIEELLPLVEEYDKAQKELDALNSSLPEALKKSILQEAIQGKLVPQDPNDEPASVLLEKIRKEKEQLVKDGKLKKKDLITTPISDDEKPFEIPESWEWCRLGEIAFVTKLAGFEYTNYIAENLCGESGVPLFKGKNVQAGKIIYEFEAYIPASISNDLPRSQITRPCLLTPYVGSIGNIGLHDRTGLYHLGSNVGKIEILCSDLILRTINLYVLYYLRSDKGLNQLSKFKKATAQESISIQAIREVFIPLPPLSEQKRIVAKIEELFKAIDNLKVS